MKLCLIFGLLMLVIVAGEDRWSRPKGTSNSWWLQELKDGQAPFKKRESITPNELSVNLVKNEEQDEDEDIIEEVSVSNKELGSEENVDASGSPSDDLEDEMYIDDDGKLCACVWYYQCLPNGYVNEEGEGLVNFRQKSQTTIKKSQGQRKCKNAIHVCCKLPEDVKPDEPIQQADNYTCGVPRIEGVDLRYKDKILSDDESETLFGEFPWMTALLRPVPESNMFAFLCGASLIHPHVALTAAHCLEELDDESKNQLLVRAGEWDSRNEEEPLPYQTREVLKIIKHPESKLKPPRYDAALLILKEPFTLADHINTICLAEAGQDFTGTNCIATGWGKTNYDDQTSYSSILRRVDLPIVNQSECQETLRRSRLGKFFKLHPSFLCAGGKKNRDTCKGDGGGPLFCEVEERKYVQVGITSWGIDCGTYPGAYTNVAKITNWIQSTIQNEGLRF